jgi:hypothetical protein
MEMIWKMYNVKPVEIFSKMGLSEIKSLMSMKQEENLED